MEQALLRYYASREKPTTPANWLEVGATFSRGFPETLQLNKNLTLKFVVPMGLARELDELNSTDVFEDSADSFIPHNPSAPADMFDCARISGRVDVISSGFRIGRAPLTVGKRYQMVDPRTNSAVCELMVLEFKFVVGSLKGQGSFGSSVRVAWTDSTLAVSEFGEPPMSALVMERQPTGKAIESKVAGATREKRDHKMKRKEKIR